MTDQQSAGITDPVSDSAREPGHLAMLDEDFRSAVVHGLVQPLTALSGRVQIAQKYLQADPARAEQALDEAREHIGRIDRMLAELRESAPDTGLMPVRKRTPKSSGSRS